jgi:periplasmic divalent cation tolerance protein
MPAQPTIALVTTPPADAQRIAEALVERRLAACVNVVPAVASTYRWEGAVQRDEEALLIIKTTSAALDAVEALLRELHPYDTFELLALDVAGGSAPYLAWLGDAVER